jgi:hypothetical protein
VTAFDGSEALARAASAYTGKPVLHMTFDEVRFSLSSTGCGHLRPCSISLLIGSISDCAVSSLP